MIPLATGLAIIDRRGPTVNFDELGAWTLRQHGTTLEKIGAWEHPGMDLLGVSSNGLWLVMQGGRKGPKLSSPFATIIKLRHELVLPDGILWRQTENIRAAREDSNAITWRCMIA